MKMIAYSKVPEKSSYIHLAYLSASAQANAPGLTGAGVGLGLLYVLIAAVAWGNNVPRKFPAAWRWFSICFVSAAVAFVLIGLVLSSSLGR